MGTHGAVQLAIPLLKQLRVSCKPFCLSPSWRPPTATPQVTQGLLHPKMKILSVFTHPHVVPNLYVFICSA